MSTFEKAMQKSEAAKRGKEDAENRVYEVLGKKTAAFAACDAAENSGTATERHYQDNLELTRELKRLEYFLSRASERARECAFELDRQKNVFNE